MDEIKSVKEWLSRQAISKGRQAAKPQQNPGYIALFEGAGANKIATVQALAKEFGKEVHHIHLSQLKGKYIGETEKNLDAVFKKAEGKNFILFFDEADALFGKRTTVKDSHDRYANQEISYLLQKMEAWPGLAILSTARKADIDSAFRRRLNAVVYFPAT